MPRVTPLPRNLTATTLAAGLALLLSACGTGDSPEPVDTASSETPTAAATATAEASPPAETTLDYSALSEREAPDRLLAYYAEALHRQQWSAAALAWESSSGVSAELLKSAYDKGEAPTLAIGRGTDEGAAGSLFYEAPVVLDFGDGGETLRGTITLRRVNDVPGASEEQLSWRIKSSTIGPKE